MYLTFSFIVQIIVALYLLLWSSFARTNGFWNIVVFKFIPLVLTTLLVINAFGLVK